MKLLNYIEANDDIRMTYKNHMSLNNFTFSETTWFLIDSFERAKGTDKLIVYILLAKVGIENNQILPDVEEELKTILSDVDLNSIKSEFSKEEFELFSNDLNEVKSKTAGA